MKIRLCPITGKRDDECADRDCELHYFYAPLKLEPCKPGRHTWIGGMCYVSNEDAAECARHRNIECETCGKAYVTGDEWED